MIAAIILLSILLLFFIGLYLREYALRVDVEMELRIKTRSENFWRNNYMELMSSHDVEQRTGT